MSVSSRYVQEARASLRAEQVAATRAAILEAARRLFGANGYAGASIDDVARAARVTKGAVYHHFASKQDLFRAVYDEVEGEAQRRTAPPDLTAPPLEQIRAGVAAYLDAVLDPETQRITLVDAPWVLGPEPDGPAAQHPGFVALRSFLAAAVDAGDLADVDPDATAHLLRGTCMQAGLFIAQAKNHRTARRKVGAVVDALLEGLRPTR